MQSRYFGSISRGGNDRGGNSNRNRGERGGRGRGFQNRGNSSSYGARLQTATSSNIADKDEDWETPEVAPIPAPVLSSRTRSTSEIDEFGDPTGSSQLEDNATGELRVQPNNLNGQCTIQSAREGIHKFKPNPTELQNFIRPPRNFTQVRMGNSVEKFTDCEQGIIHDPPAVDMHPYRNSESSLNEEELSAQHQRALSLFNKDKFAESLSEFKIVLDKRTTLLGPQHVDTLRSHFFVGRCLHKEQKVSEAKNILEHVLEIQKSVLPADHGNIEETEFAVARCFDKLEKYKEAEVLYRTVYAKHKKTLDHKDTLITQFNLANALDKQNKLDDAMKWYGAFVAMGVQNLGPGNELIVHGQERIKCILSNSV